MSGLTIPQSTPQLKLVESRTSGQLFFWRRCVGISQAELVASEVAHLSWKAEKGAEKAA